MIDQLIQKYPNNPYFYELKAQMLRENGNLNSALENYLKAIKVAPNDSLILIELAQTQINFNSHNYSFQAIQNLKKASLNENENQSANYMAYEYVKTLIKLCVFIHPGASKTSSEARGAPQRIRRRARRMPEDPPGA